MAVATSTTMARSTVLAPARDLSSLISTGSSFRINSIPQLAPVNSKKTSRLVLARANLFEEQNTKIARRDVLASVVAAGAALSFAGQGLANPLAAVKEKTDQLVNGAKNAAPKIPTEGIQNSAGSAVDEVKSRMDGIVGKNKPGPALPGNRVASTNGGTGSAIGDAQKRISNFGKNPFAENVEKASKDADNVIANASGEKSGSARAAKEFLGQDSTRVDEATKKVGNLGSNLQKKAGDAVNEGKNFVGQAQRATPNLPDLPSAPSLPNIPTPNAGNLFSGLKSNVESKLEDTKGAVGSALQ